MTTSGAPRTARARVRAELTLEIKATARRQLADSGAAALSLRAIARDMEMASSALYRYFPSRDELLTALIIDAYESVGAAAAQAESEVRRGNFSRRWMVTAKAVHTWAVASPQEYALIFGSPVPGYRAPVDTIDPAARIPLLLIAIVRDAAEAGLAEAPGQPLPRAVKADLVALAQAVAPTVSPAQLARTLMAWSQLIGLISFELFGHLHNVIHDYESHFDFQLRGVGQSLGLTKPAKTAA